MKKQQWKPAQTAGKEMPSLKKKKKLKEQLLKKNGQKKILMPQTDILNEKQ